MMGFDIYSQILALLETKIVIVIKKKYYMIEYYVIQEFVEN